LTGTYSYSTNSGGILLCEVNVTSSGSQIVGIGLGFCGNNTSTGGIIGWYGQGDLFALIGLNTFTTTAEDHIRYVLYTTTAFGNFFESLKLVTKSGRESQSFGYFPPQANKLEVGYGLLGATISNGGPCFEGECSPYQQERLMGLKFDYICPDAPTPAPTPAPTYSLCVARELGRFGIYTFQSADVGLGCKVDISYDSIAVRGIEVTYCDNGFSQGIIGFTNGDNSYPELQFASFSTTVSDPILLVLYDDSSFSINALQS